MDTSILSSLASSPNQENQAKAVQYFEELKNSENGWQICLQALSAGDSASDNYNIFFCLQVIEHYIKARYKSAPPQERLLLREFLKNQHQWSRYTETQAFIRNKIAQVMALIFIQDYPSQWPSFFDELLSNLSLGDSSIDHFLRVLIAIDSEIADRDIPRSNDEIRRSNLIKDAMREGAVLNLVDAWHTILGLENSHSIVRQCLIVIGSYIIWIDINLIANDRFVSILVQKLADHELRESSADCIHGIISKGMDPKVKWKLIESFFTVLTNIGVWQAIKDSNSESEYLIKLGKVLNIMGVNLIEAHQKMSKEPNEVESLLGIEQAIVNKMCLLYEFLLHEDDDVSLSVFDFVRDYLHTLKNKPTLTDFQKKSLEKILSIVMKKIRFDEYNFDHEGEDEALFLEYRKQLKIIFDNIALIDKSLVIEHTQQVLNLTLNNWRQIPFEDVEAALLLFYLLGETIPTSGTSHFHPDIEKSSPIQLMLLFLHSTDIHLHSHPSVIYQYFETVVRYEKFYNCHPDYIMKVLSSFLENNGLFHPCKKVRSRSTYLFSRFIRGIRAHLTSELTTNILHAINPLLLLKIPSKDAQSSQEEMLLSDDDQLYLYEVVGMIIVSGEKSSQKKEEYIRSVITPLCETVRIASAELKIETNQERKERLGAVILQAISLSGRISKAFSNQQSMKACGSIPIFLDALQVFIRALDIPDLEQHSIIQSGVRQYLHRLVVCMEEEILPYIPSASQELLKNCDCKTIQEYIPLINQVISKFKLSWIFQKEIAPFLQQMFTPMVESIFTNLAIPIEPNDQQAIRERQLLQRMYFQFIATIVINNVIDVLANQNTQVLERVMQTIISGCVDFPDPVAQKSCFSTLRKLVEIWGGIEGGPEGFIDFMYKQIVPACFLAPMKPTFDLLDGQTVIVLNETALCLRTIFEKRKEELVVYLQNHYLPSINLNHQIIIEYLQALQSNNATFKNYLKILFQELKKHK